MIIAHVSDAHITDGNAEPSRLFKRAVDHLMQLPARPDVVIVSGDCVENGSPHEYAEFRAILSPLTMPIYVIPGNHDHRANLLEAFGPQGANPLDGFAQYTVEDFPVRLIALDTHIPGAAAGTLCDQRLHWLAEQLADRPDKPTLIFMHHPPFQTGLLGFDAIGLQNAGAFAQIVGEHTHVERIVAGHVHAAMQGRYAGTLAMTCPSTMYQFVSDYSQHTRIVAHKQPPACLIHAWDDATGLLTHTSAIGEYGKPTLIHDGTRWV